MVFFYLFKRNRIFLKDILLQNSFKVFFCFVFCFQRRDAPTRHSRPSSKISSVRNMLDHVESQAKGVPRNTPPPKHHSLLIAFHGLMLRLYCLRQYLIASLDTEQSSWCLARSFTPSYQHSWYWKVLSMTPEGKDHHQHYNNDMPSR